MPNRCAYVNCKGVPCSSIHRFPVKNDDLMRQWIVNSGNPSLLHLEKEKLREKYICGKHFPETAFLDPASKKRLKPSAVPYQYVEKIVTNSPSVSPVHEVSKEVKTYCGPCSVNPSSGGPEKLHETSPSQDLQFLSDITNMPSRVRKRKPTTVVNPSTEKCKHAKELKAARVRISKLKAANKLLKQEATTDHVLETFNFPSEHSRTLATMQFKTKKRKWTKQEKTLALTLFYKSPSTYNFMRRQNIVLPGPSTVRDWIGSCCFQPGFCREFFTQIKHKFDEKPDSERAVVLCFDEMAIMECKEYNKQLDIVEGFEDFGNNKRTNQPARYALVFLVRGLYNAWKLPIAYFLSHKGVRSDDLAKLIVEVVQKLFEANLIPKVCVCDQGANNRSTYTVLGVSTEEPFFVVEGKTIFALHDAPHLFKNIRTNLQEGDFLLNGKRVSFKDILTVYNIDKANEKCRALPKLTDAHIMTHWSQKMSVKLAVQVLSHSVAAAIKTCVDSGEINSETARDTAEFIEFLDHLFDSLNSKTLFSKNPYRSALSYSNSYVLETFNKAVEVFSHLVKINAVTRKTSRPICFEGMVQTVQGVKMLFEREATNSDISFILTNRLNQDALEHLFSVYRQKGGYNRNPTARTLRTIFRSHALNSLMRTPSSTNCEPDDDITVDVPDVDHPLYQDSEESDDSGSSTSTVSEFSREENLEDCSVSYFAGYLAQKCLQEFNCEKCADSLVCDLSKMEDEHQLLIINKMYEDAHCTSLLAPSMEFRKIVDTSCETFEKEYTKFFHLEKVSQNIRKKNSQKNS